MRKEGKEGSFRCISKTMGIMNIKIYLDSQSRERKKKIKYTVQLRREKII